MGRRGFRLNGEAKFVEGISALVPGRRLELPPLVGSKENGEHLLRPREAALFEWGYGYPLSEWAKAHNAPGMEHGVCELEVVVVDYDENGILDRICVVMQARPLEEVTSNRRGEWRVTDLSHTGVTVYPAQRTYGTESRSQD